MVTTTPLEKNYGIHPGCNYYAFIDSVCKKCGQLVTKEMVAEAEKTSAEREVKVMPEYAQAECHPHRTGAKDGKCIQCAAAAAREKL